MRVPEFPRFDSININHREFVSSVAFGFEPYSDYNMLSLLSWNVGEVNCISDLNGNLVIKLMDYLGDTFIYLFMGKNDVEKCMKKLIDYFGELDCVPEFCKVKSDQLVFAPDRGSFDYVYDLSALSSLEGAHYRSIRKKVKKFEVLYPEVSVRVSDVMDKKTAKDLLTLTTKWGHDHNFDDKKVSEDIKMTENFIKYSKFFKCFILGVYLGDDMVAFTFNEMLSDGWAMGHFGKALNLYDGASVFAEYQTAKYLLEEGFTFINDQQDTGLLGLREYKESLRPCRYLRKYSVVSRG